MLTTGEIQKIFSVSAQTVRNWCHEFREFLSPSATPTASGTRRRFTEDDLKVFALIVSMTAADQTYKDVKEALAKGERGALPELPDEEPDPTSLMSTEEFHRTRLLLKERDEAIGQVKQLMLQVEQDREHNRQILQEKDQEISRLNRQIGKLEVELEMERKKNLDTVNAAKEGGE
jgi:DNA-binding transcriptional MerR regulator